MTAYGNMDPAIAGLKDGLGGRVESWRASEDLAFGSPVFGYKGDAQNAYPFLKDVGTIVLSADLVTANVVNASVNGDAIAPITFATDHDTTIAAVVAAINGLTGVEAILDPADTDSRTIQVRVKGEAAVVTLAVTLGATQATATITYGSGQIFLGVALFTQKESAGIAKYFADEAMNVLSDDGRVWVPSATAADANSSAFLSTAGAFSNSGADIGCRFRSTRANAGLAIVEVSGQKALALSAKF